MQKPILKIFLVQLVFFMALNQAAFAQNEAASSATDAQLESQTSAKSETIKIGKKISLKLNGERALRQPQKFEGIVDSVVVVGNDSIPISRIALIQEVDSRMNDWGTGLTIFGLIYLVGLVALTVWSSFLLFGFYYGPLFTVVSTIGVLGLFLTPAALTIGIVFLALSKRSFPLGRKWKLRGKTESR